MKNCGKSSICPHCYIAAHTIYYCMSKVSSMVIDLRYGITREIHNWIVPHWSTDYLCAIQLGNHCWTGSTQTTMNKGNEGAMQWVSMQCYLYSLEIETICLSNLHKIQDKLDYVVLGTLHLTKRQDGHGWNSIVI